MRVRAGNTRQHPSQELPITANPAVPTVHICIVAVRIFLIEHYIAQQPRPRITPFQKIVAEDPVLGETSFERSLEGINFVYAFADERAFTK